MSTHSRHCSRSLAVAFLASLWWSVPLARAEQLRSAQPTVLLPDQIELARLVDLAAQRLRVPIEYDPKVLLGLVTLRMGGVAPGGPPREGGAAASDRSAGLSDEELWTLTNRLLASRGFTTVRQEGPGFGVVKIEAAAQSARLEDLTRFSRDVIANTNPAEPLPGYRSVITRVNHRATKEVIDSVKVLLSKSGSAIAEVPGTGTPAVLAGAGAAQPGSAGSAGPNPANAGGGASASGGLLVISDLSPRIELALDLLRRMDSPVESGVVTEVEMKFLSPAQAVALARTIADRREAVVGKKPLGELLPAPSGTGVLVIAPAERVAYWQDLLAQLDKREGVEKVNYTPRHFALRDVAKLIEESISDRGGASYVGSSGVIGAAAGSPFPTPSGATGSLSLGSAVVDDRFRMIVDDLTGTLTITATPTQHQKIAELMARLDAVPPAARRPVRSYTLKNRPVKEVIGVLSSMLAAGVLEGGEIGGTGDPGTTGKASPGSEIGAVQPGDQYTPGVAPTLPARSGNRNGSEEQDRTGRNTRGVNERGSQGGNSGGTGASGETQPARGGAAGNFTPSLSLSADDATNTLIAVGEPRLLAQLESLLVTLDVRQPQVMLEVLLLSLTDSQTLALGIELDKITRSGDAQIRLSSVFGISTTNAGAGNTSVGGTGGTVTVLSPAEFSIVIKALETLNKGRSLSVPRLLVSNNQKGDFTSNLQQPVQTSTTQNQTTTQGFSGYEQAGTTVSVQPQITEADHLLLQYNVTLSSFVGQGAGSLPPPRQENKLSSQVSIPDGYTVALGGIELATTGEQNSQVPLLSSIPLIGEAFKSRSNSDSRSRFFVFIRAEVMRNTSFEDLKYASDLATKEAGVDDGFPTVKPQVMR